MAQLIQECIDNFNISSDRAALSRIVSSLGSLQQSREDSLSIHHGAFKRTCRQLQTLQQQHDLALGNHNPAEHAQSILNLDTQKFRIAKEASDLEIEGERLDGELTSLDKQLADTEAVRAGDEWAGRERELQDVLRLKLYRSLGIDLETNNAGAFCRAVVRNSDRRDAKVIDVDSRLPSNHYSGHFWEAM